MAPSEEMVTFKNDQPKESARSPGRQVATQKQESDDNVGLGEREEDNQGSTDLQHQGIVRSPDCRAYLGFAASGIISGDGERLAPTSFQEFIRSRIGDPNSDWA